MASATKLQGERAAEMAALVLGDDEHPLHLADAAAEVPERDAPRRRAAHPGEKEPALGWREAAGQRGELGVEGGRVEVAVDHRPVAGMALVVPAEVAPHQVTDRGEVGGARRLVDDHPGHRRHRQRGCSHFGSSAAVSIASLPCGTP